MNELTVGQKLYLVPSTLDCAKNREPKEVTISKVGQKYFYLQEYQRNKYDIETLQEVNNFNYKGQCYFTLQEILNLREINSLYRKIREYFSGYREKEISLENLRKINELIK